MKKPKKMLCVMIAGQIVHLDEEIKDEVLIMSAHNLRRKYCIYQLRSHGIDCGVYVKRDGSWLEVTEDGVSIGTIQSKMNDPDFVYTDDWFDTKIAGR